MSGYDGREFLARVRAHQLHVRGRTAPTGCWVCDVLMPRADRGVRAYESELRRCEQVSGGIVDAHHVLPKQVIKREATRAPDALAAHGPPQDLRVQTLAVDSWRWTPLEDLLMDPRNGILVRRFHHDALEHRTLAIPVTLLPPDVLEFAGELGLRWWLENQEARRAG